MPSLCKLSLIDWAMACDTISIINANWLSNLTTGCWSGRSKGFLQTEVAKAMQHSGRQGF